jgi:hypothetical protein
MASALTLIERRDFIFLILRRPQQKPKPGIGSLILASVIRQLSRRERSKQDEIQHLMAEVVELQEQVANVATRCMVDDEISLGVAVAAAVSG